MAVVARRSVAYKWIALSNTTLGALMAPLLEELADGAQAISFGPIPVSAPVED
jgi:hypothetical protein